MVDYGMPSNATEYNRQYYYKRRAKIIEFMGGVCNLCGSTHELEFDHINRDEKAFDIRDNLTLNSILDELQKCQLLCSDCHRLKTANENRGFTHGTLYAWMKKKCECQTCSEVKRKWHDERNTKRRAGKPRQSGPVPCGTYRAYKRGCKCGLCRKANADYNRELKKSKPV